MRTSFFAKTAWTNLGKNSRFYIPHILTGAGLQACFYIVLTLAMDERLSQVKGGSYIPTLMGMATVVMGILSLILMLYTNTFLMKQRRYEFGLYNVLGMEKRHVNRVMFFETLFSSVISILCGTVGGILLYKISSLLICKFLQTDIVAGFYYIEPQTLFLPMAAFALFDTVTFLLNRRSVNRMKPVALLFGKHIGEKATKVNWPILLIGLLCMGTGYTIALVTKQPLQAIFLFFLAVILVIIGTYCLFTAGTVWILKALKKNENYYYSKKHMSSVSGLLFRMKQNAVGLASICILATGILVMLSTTVSLYIGMDQTMDARYPEEMYLTADYYDSEDHSYAFPTSVLQEAVYKAAEEQNIKINYIQEQRFLEVNYNYENGELSAETEYSYDKLDQIADFTIITQQTYQLLTGEELQLEKNETAIVPLAITTKNRFNFNKGFSLTGIDFSVKKQISYFPIQPRMASAVNCFGLVVADDDVLQMIYEAQKKQYGENSSDFTHRIAVSFENRNEACEKGNAICDNITDFLLDYAATQIGEEAGFYQSWDCLWDSKTELIGAYGTFLFLGLLLGSVCLFATALIIYYKQISEGYEDKNRFRIMQNIGMSKTETRQAINNQLLLQFFLPPAVAAVHISVAFPILTKMLHMLLLNKTSLFLLCTAVVYILFILLYTIIYKLTAKTYENIVSRS